MRIYRDTLDNGLSLLTIFAIYLTASIFHGGSLHNDRISW